MPELQQAGDSRPIAVRNLRREPPAVTQAQRPQAEGRGQTSGNDGQSKPVSGEQGIIPTVTTINPLDDFLRTLDANPSWREAVRARILNQSQSGI